MKFLNIGAVAMAFSARDPDMSEYKREAWRLATGGVFATIRNITSSDYIQDFIQSPLSIGDFVNTLGPVVRIIIGQAVGGDPIQIQQTTALNNDPAALGTRSLPLLASLTRPGTSSLVNNLLGRDSAPASAPASNSNSIIDTGNLLVDNNSIINTGGILVGDNSIINTGGIFVGRRNSTISNIINNLPFFSSNDGSEDGAVGQLAGVVQLGGDPDVVLQQSTPRFRLVPPSDFSRFYVATSGAMFQPSLLNEGFSETPFPRSSRMPFTDREGRLNADRFYRYYHGGDYEGKLSRRPEFVHPKVS